MDKSWSILWSWSSELKVNPSELVALGDFSSQNIRMSTASDATPTEEKLQEQLREFLVNATGDPKYAEYELKLCAEYIKE